MGKPVCMSRVTVSGFIPRKVYSSLSIDQLSNLADMFRASVKAAMSDQLYASTLGISIDVRGEHELEDEE